MEPGILKNESRFNRRLCLILIICLLVSSMLPGVVAKSKKFDTEEFEEKITIPRNEFREIDFAFKDGKELEIIYTIQEKQGLPIDVWFVSEDNYLLLTSGAQFLYFIDGTDQEVSYTKKIVVLKEYDDYKLVMTNYRSNQTVEVDIEGEIRTYKDGSEETFWDYSTILLYTLIIIIIILAILLILLGFWVRTLKQAEIKQLLDKVPEKKGKGKKRKGAKKTKVSAKKTRKAKEASGVAEFCGYCGEPVDTPFCKSCGRKI